MGVPAAVVGRGTVVDGLQLAAAVRQHVLLPVAARREGALADAARERLLLGVAAVVNVQRAPAAERLEADVTARADARA